jgi:hypothetical protein
VGLVIAFVVRNVFCLTFGVKNVASLVKRSGVIYIINLILLALREHINVVASWYRLSLRAFVYIYKWLGIVALVKGLVYIIVGAAS